MRTHYNTDITDTTITKDVTLSGWINSIRDHGGVYFIDLRDKSGIIQIVINSASLDEDTLKKIHTLRNEFVIQVNGTVRKRGEGLENPNLITGNIEVVTEDIHIFSKAKTLPFDPNDTKVGIETRNKYRYLELRNKQQADLLRSRSKIAHAIRNVLIGKGFVEVETPTLIKTSE